MPRKKVVCRRLHRRRIAAAVLLTCLSAGLLAPRPSVARAATAARPAAAAAAARDDDPGAGGSCATSFIDEQDVDATPDPRDLSLVPPFSGWTHHTTDAAHAVAAVHVMDASGKEVRGGSGFVARCDGFVLVPGALFPAANDRSGEHILVSFASADGETLSAALPAVGPPRFRSRRAPYVLIKVNDHHLPCLPMLDSICVRAGDHVKVFWPRPQATPEAQAVSEAAGATIVSVTKGGRSFAIQLDSASASASSADAAKAPSAASPTAQTPPDGAVIATADGRASLGVVASDARDPKDLDYAPPAPGTVTCASYAALYWVSNDIGLKLSPADVPGGDSAASRVADSARSPEGAGMIRIPGGPVRLDGTYAYQYKKRYGVDYACCPEFYIDANPVTVGPYRDWLAQYRSLRQPEGWIEENELQERHRPANMPVVSLWDQDAMSYAASVGKRMVTPVEWAKATLGPNENWFETYNYNFNQIRKTLQCLDLTKKSVYINMVNEITASRKVTNAAAAANIYYCATPDMLELNREELRVFRKWFRRYWFAEQISTIDRDPKDVSQYGVHHVLMNAPEMLQPNLGAGTQELAWKPHASSVDPYTSFIRYECRFVDIQPDGLDDVFITFFPGNGVRPDIKTVPGRGSTMGGYEYQTNLRSGFRCAR